MVERLIETPREAVERSLYELAATVEANDVQGALAFMAQGASPQFRSDVTTLMPLVKIERARVVDTPKINVNERGDAATVECHGMVLAINRRDGMKGGAEDHVTMTWVRQGDRWLVQSYASDKSWHSAVGKVKGPAAGK